MLQQDPQQHCTGTSELALQSCLLLRIYRVRNITSTNTNKQPHNLASIIAIKPASINRDLRTCPAQQHLPWHCQVSSCKRPRPARSACSCMPRLGTQRRTLDTSRRRRHATRRGRACSFRQRWWSTRGQWDSRWLPDAAPVLSLVCAWSCFLLRRSCSHRGCKPCCFVVSVAHGGPTWQGAMHNQRRAALHCT